MTRSLWIAWGLIAVAIAATVVLILAVRSRDASSAEKDRDAARQRYELCVQVEGIKRSERRLWLGVIARTKNADPKQVAAFKADLFRFFPPRPCNRTEAR